MTHPKDFTEQEKIIAEYLTGMGLRYDTQVSISKYTVDFLVEDHIILEADGVYGHFKKANQQRDLVLESLGYRIEHISEQSKNGIKKYLLEVTWEV